MPITATSPSPVRVFLITVLICASGFVAAAVLGGTFGASRAIFLTIGFPGMVAGLAIMALAMPLGRAGVFDGLSRALDRAGAGPAIWGLALASLIVSILGTHLVFGGFALSMDEFMPRLQAEIFAWGHLTATLPEEWHGTARAMFHGFATVDRETGQVASSYRPGMAILIWLFDRAGLGLYVSAVLQAGSVLLAARVASQMFPDAPRAPLMAALLVATSSQALAMSLTSYAMTGHLFFNLLWLHLFFRDRLWAHVAAALVGVATASLHQVHPHVFFAAPFFVLLLRPFRPGLFLLYGAIYLIGHLAVLSWDRVLIQQAAEQGAEDARSLLDNLAGIARLPALADWASVWVNIVRFLAWQSLAVFPLLICARAARPLPRNATLLVASILLTLAPHPFLMPDQGHGWGYRYLHGQIGSVALLAALGWDRLQASKNPVRMSRFVVVLLIATPLLIWPLKAWQINGFVAPFRSAAEAVKDMDARVVIVDTYRIWFGSDIARNSAVAPTEPIALMLHSLEPAQIEALCERSDTRFFTTEDAEAQGLSTHSLETYLETYPKAADTALPIFDALRTSGCLTTD
ncbi:hypothetical protein [Litorisediminicola beolgyonensis]|uniref:Glycosyltransferase RgtA/B/C/D-like domain-containing protein n=1 Tax=Litorisediminicola beolgyonensis TaxID=1173614 RepID=A0ABW3ZIT2_9RHOB